MLVVKVSAESWVTVISLRPVRFSWDRDKVRVGISISVSIASIWLSRSIAAVSMISIAVPAVPAVIKVSDIALVRSGGLIAPVVAVLRAAITVLLIRLSVIAWSRSLLAPSITIGYSGPSVFILGLAAKICRGLKRAHGGSGWS